MRIIIYRTEPDEYQHNILVREAVHNCADIHSLSNPAGIVKMLNSLFSLNKRAEEYVYMLAMNKKCKPLGVFEISHGSVAASVCSPREIFIRALLCGASGIVIVHNHPSGDVTPSQTDGINYKKLLEAGNLIGINLLDSIIIGDDNYYSFMEQE